MQDKIFIEDNREEGSSALEQGKLVMLRMLRVIDVICEREGLDYWLDFGTLLGAVRHKGFIPWDDDIDIAMPRKDLIRFEKILPKYLPDDMFFQTHETDASRNSFIVKLRDRYSSFLTDNSSADEHKGIFIDIFTMDYVKKNRILAFLRFLYPVNIKLPLFLRLIEKSLYPITRPIFKNIGMSAIDKFFLKRNIDKEDARLLSYGLGGIPTKAYKKETIFPLKRMSFEGYDFNVPNDTHAYLQELYGDYMKLPPVSEQVNKHAKDILPFTSCKHIESLDWATRKE